MRRAAFVLATVALLLGAGGATALAGPGDLDTGFGVQGIALTAFEGGINRASALAIQPDGKYIVAGTHQTWEPSYGNLTTTVYVTLVRFSAGGTLDPGFGTGGRVRINLSQMYFDRFGLGGYGGAFRGVGDVALLDDGRIVVASGYGVNSSGDIVGADAIACFTSTGQLDTTFGTGGIVVLDVSPWSLSHGGGGWNRRLAVTPDGKLLFGCTLATSSNDDFVVYRLNPNGTPDAAFGSSGRKIVDLAGGSDDDLSWMAPLPDGRIYVGGACQVRDTGLVRLGADGSLDASFGSSGRVVTTEKYQVPAVDAVCTAEGGVLAVGGSGWNAFLRRYSPDGSPDGSFGTTGQVQLFDLAGYDPDKPIWLKRVVLQANGDLIVCGTKDNGFPTYRDIWVSRRTADGSLDTGFGTNGAVVTDLGAADDCAAAGIGPDGKLVVAGYALAPGSATALIARRSVVRATGATGIGLARYDAGRSVVRKPVLTKLRPSQGKIGTTVILTGRNFGSTRGSSYVKFGGTKAKKYVGWTTTRIKVKVPKGTAKGKVKVTVTTSAGKSGARAFRRK